MSPIAAPLAAPRAAFQRRGGGQIELAAVVEKILGVGGTHESGGILMGRWLQASRDVVVDDVTVPGPDDIATRHRFQRHRDPHQARMDEAWKASRGVVTYLGEWHTHPGACADPSRRDLCTWKRIMREARFDGDALFFLIVGGDGLRMWEMERDVAPVEISPFAV